MPEFTILTEKLNVTITKTANGLGEYVQILSPDMLINVVLIAKEIKVDDQRERGE